MTTRWFVNEDGGVYEYDLTTQPIEFPQDFHSPYRTKKAAEVAAEDLDDAREAMTTPVTEPESARGLTFTREQVEAWVGHSLTDQQVEDIEQTLPNSSLPDTVETVAHEALEIPYPEDERTCQHCHQLIHDVHGAWVDRTQGDVCGWDGGNEPHDPIVNPPEDEDEQ